jgi:hypothetical protein
MHALQLQSRLARRPTLLRTGTPLSHAMTCLQQKSPRYPEPTPHSHLQRGVYEIADGDEQIRIVGQRADDGRFACVERRNAVGNEPRR